MFSPEHIAEAPTSTITSKKTNMVAMDMSPIVAVYTNGCKRQQVFRLLGGSAYGIIKSNTLVFKRM
jgi:hypothetical protein